MNTEKIKLRSKDKKQEKRGGIEEWEGRREGGREKGKRKNTSLMPRPHTCTCRCRLTSVERNSHYNFHDHAPHGYKNSRPRSSILHFCYTQI